MRTSETVSQLAAALCKAQSTMTHAIKDANNPFFHSKYADLASVVEASRPSLAKNGLSVVQCTWGNALFTRLLHESGEWIEGSIELKPMRQVKDKGWEESHDPQSYGSCITYARRYAMAAITGVATEDDDGNAASGNKVVKTVDVKPANPATSPPVAAVENQASHPPAPQGKSVEELRLELAELGQIAVDAGIYATLGDAIQSFTTTEKFKSKCRDVAGLTKDWAIKNALIKAQGVLNAKNPQAAANDDIPY